LEQFVQDGGTVDQIEQSVVMRLQHVTRYPDD